MSLAAIHIVQLVPTFQQTPLLGVAYVFLIAAAVAVAARLGIRSSVGASAVAPGRRYWSDEHATGQPGRGDLGLHAWEWLPQRGGRADGGRRLHHLHSTSCVRAASRHWRQRKLTSMMCSAPARQRKPTLRDSKIADCHRFGCRPARSAPGWLLTLLGISSCRSGNSGSGSVGVSHPGVPSFDGSPSKTNRRTRMDSPASSSRRQPAADEAVSGEGEAIEVHDHDPRRHEVVHERGPLESTYEYTSEMSRSWAFEPESRSTALPVQMSWPVLRSRPSYTFSDEAESFHSCSCRAGLRRNRWSATGRAAGMEQGESLSSVSPAPTILQHRSRPDPITMNPKKLSSATTRIANTEHLTGLR
jgi:hypothetical protein